MNNQIVFYHGKCFDGSMAAAAAVFANSTGVLRDAQVVPVSYQDDLLAPEGLLSKVNPSEQPAAIYFLDFCPKAAVLTRLVELGHTITVLDHHESAMNDAKAVDGVEGIFMRFDMGKSGARMAWDFFHSGFSYPEFQGGHMPELALHVEDRDLWKFNMEGTREAIAWLSVATETDNPESYLAASVQFQKDPKQYIQIGSFIRKEMAVQIQTMASRWRSVDIPGYPSGAIVNASCYSSEVAEAVYDKIEVPYVIVYAITKDGRVSLSFRSKQGKDYSARVNDIAKMFDGGGHPNAAGGSTSLETLNELLLASKSQKHSNFKVSPATCSC